MNGASANGLVQLLPLILLLVALYFFMLRPQKKKDKQINEMRNNLSVGDEIVTIGGICGKIVKTKDETVVIQVGADKVKFEMMRWSISSVTKPAPRKASRVEADVEEAPAKKSMPKKLKKSSEVEEIEKVEDAVVSEAVEAVETAAEESVEK